jgi:hypothetical protein
MKRSSFLVFISLLVAAFAHAQPSFIRDSLDRYISKGMKDWNIPGLAIVIVKDRKVVVMKGYGVRNLETKKPVDENTLFMIGSNSKLFHRLVPRSARPSKKSFRWMIRSQNIFPGSEFTIQTLQTWLPSGI